MSRKYKSLHSMQKRSQHHISSCGNFLFGNRNRAAAAAAASASAVAIYTSTTIKCHAGHRSLSSGIETHR